MCWVWSGPSCCPGAVPAAGTACAFRCLVREALWRSDGRAVEVLGLILPLSGRSPSDVLALERPVVMSRALLLLLGPRVRFAASFGKLCGAPTGGGSSWLGVSYRRPRAWAGLPFESIARAVRHRGCGLHVRAGSTAGAQA
jgi:hypothetical protein